MWNIVWARILCTYLASGLKYSSIHECLYPFPRMSLSSTSII